MVSHLDHDRLVFLALGETEADQVETRHLASCTQCRSEVEKLRQVATIGGESQGLSDLPEPPAHLWPAIAAEVAAAQSLPSINGAVRPAPMRMGTVGGEGGSTGSPGAVHSGAGDRTATGRWTSRGRRWPGWATTVATAVAAAAAGVLGTLAVVNPADRPADQPPAVAATANLAAYGTTPASANGEARVFRNGELHLHVSNLPSVDGYYEVWLINPDTMEMFSVGVLGRGSDALLPLPPNVDLSAYSVVDVSAEHYDNDTAHSGTSLLRGKLGA